MQPTSPVVPQAAVVSTPVSAEPLLGIPIAEGSSYHLSASTLDYLPLFTAYTAALRAEHRRRGAATPPNSPTSEAGGHSSANVPSTRPQHLDLNQVD